jgi:hypothetical protein
MRATPYCCLVFIALATPALALDLNSFRAQHGRPALSVSSTLAGAAYFFSVIPGRGR